MIISTNKELKTALEKANDGDTLSGAFERDTRSIGSAGKNNSTDDEAFSEIVELKKEFGNYSF